MTNSQYIFSKFRIYLEMQKRTYDPPSISYKAKKGLPH